MRKDVSILIVDDEKEVCELLSEFFTGLGYNVFTAGDGTGARKIVGKELIDIVFLDLKLSGETGVTLLPSLLSIKPSLKIIVIAAYPALQSQLEAKENGAYDYFVKP